MTLLVRRRDLTAAGVLPHWLFIKFREPGLEPRSLRGKLRLLHPAIRTCAVQRVRLDYLWAFTSFSKSVTRAVPFEANSISCRVDDCRIRQPSRSASFRRPVRHHGIALLDRRQAAVTGTAAGGTRTHSKPHAGNVPEGNSQNGSNPAVARATAGRRRTTIRDAAARRFDRRGATVAVMSDCLPHPCDRIAVKLINPPARRPVRPFPVGETIRWSAAFRRQTRHGAGSRVPVLPCRCRNRD